MPVSAGSQIEGARSAKKYFLLGQCEQIKCLPRVAHMWLLRNIISVPETFYWKWVDNVHKARAIMELFYLITWYFNLQRYHLSSWSSAPHELHCNFARIGSCSLIVSSWVKRRAAYCHAACALVHAESGELSPTLWHSCQHGVQQLSLQRSRNRFYLLRLRGSC